MFDDHDIRMVDSEVSYLRMNHSVAYRDSWDHSLEIVPLVKPIDPNYYLELYQSVGLNCSWLDRMFLSEAELTRQINSPDTSIFLFFSSDDPCGYVEFVMRTNYLEILYFGLFTEFLGKGHGIPFLKMALNEAWKMEPDWIELNTCDLDDSRAIDLYLRVGFEVYNRVIEKRRVIE